MQMKKSRLIFAASAFAVLTLGLGSCSDDEPGKNDNGGINDVPGEVVDGMLTPDQSKEYIQKTADLLYDRLSTTHQQEILDFSKNFVAEYGDYELPSNFMGDDEENSSYVRPFNPAKAMVGVEKALRTGDYVGMTRAIETMTFRFSDYAGIYEPSSYDEEWVKKGTGNGDVVFRCTVNGKSAELKAVRGGSMWTGRFQWTDTWDYGWDSGSDTYDYTPEVPTEITLTLTYGGQELMRGVVKSDLSQSAKTARVETTVSSKNLNVKATVNITNTSIEENATVNVVGDDVLVTRAHVDGNNLCDFDKLRSLFTSENVENIVDNYFTSGKVSVTLMNRIRVEGSAKDLSLIVKAMDFDDDFDKNDSAQEKEVRRLCTNACELVNQKIVANVYFTGSNKIQAIVKLRPFKNVDDYSSYGYWECMPAIEFEVDGTSYYFDEYFNNKNFGNLSTQFENLFDRYAAFFED